MAQRSGVAQRKFKALGIENFAGSYAVTGWVNSGVTDAAHTEHGTRYNPSDDILITPAMYTLLDADFMGIDPGTQADLLMPLVVCASGGV